MTSLYEYYNHFHRAVLLNTGLTFARHILFIFWLNKAIKFEEQLKYFWKVRNLCENFEKWESCKKLPRNFERVSRNFWEIFKKWKSFENFQDIFEEVSRNKKVVVKSIDYWQFWEKLFENFLRSRKLFLRLQDRRLYCLINFGGVIFGEQNALKD